MKTFVNLTGQTLCGLTINGILRYQDGEPVYSTRCTDPRCSVTQLPILHKHFQNGSAKCPSPVHNGIVAERSGTSLARTGGIAPTGSARTQLEKAAFTQTETPSRPLRCASGASEFSVPCDCAACTNMRRQI
jgi:hypothetical protein